MNRLLLLLVLISTGLIAQTTTIQVKRGTNANLPTTYSAGQPLWTQDSLNFYVQDSVNSRNQYVGGNYSQTGVIHYAASSAGTDSFRVNRVPQIRALRTGTVAVFKADVANTGAAYLNVDSTGWYQLTKSGTTALADGDIASGQVNTARFDGTYWQIQGGTSNSFPDENFIFVQNYAGLTHTSASSSTGFTEARNDSIKVWGTYLPTKMKLGKIAFYTGALTGSAPTRTVSVAVYNAAKQLVDSTAATAYVASNAMPASFVNNAVAGPGWVYFAFSTYISTTGTFRFNVVNVDVNYGAAAIFLGQSTTYPIVSSASEVLSAGAGWPATLTLSRIVSVYQFPAMLVWGTTVD
jgi:hypothetical protein